jgi:uncharacterized membrane protein YbhN (UPF0104 family)
MLKKFTFILRWLILGLVIFFLASNFLKYWDAIALIKISNQGYFLLLCSFVFTFLSHVFAGVVWGIILDIFKIKLAQIEVIKIYLITNIAKYLPGNIWHFYGRISALTGKGYSLYVAGLSVVLEPLLMACAGLLITIISANFGLINNDKNGLFLAGQFSLLVAVLVGIHPQIINPILQKLTRSKLKKLNDHPQELSKLTSYPLVPLLGELGFLLIRGTGFIFALMALIPIKISSIPILFSVFSFAWLLGLVIPGAPGGMGVFEATVIAGLDTTQFPPAIVLGALGLFRIINILAEAIAALFAWLFKG